MDKWSGNVGNYKECHKTHSHHNQKLEINTKLKINSPQICDCLCYIVQHLQNFQREQRRGLPYLDDLLYLDNHIGCNI